MHGALPQVDGAERLFALLRDAPREGIERSFKLAAGTLLGERWLVGLPLARTDEARVLALCRELGMPGAYAEEFRAALPEARVAHFGSEASAEGLLYKAYLEFPDRLAAREAGPVVLHVAWKWDAARPARRSVATYRCHPGLSLRGAFERMDALYGDAAGGAGLALLKDIAALAGGRTAEPLMYLEVNEEGNARASFDLNVHAAELRMRDVEPQLRGLRAHFRIPPAVFEAACAPVRGAPLGHLSGGRSRAGTEFATIYFTGEGR